MAVPRARAAGEAGVEEPDFKAAKLGPKELKPEDLEEGTPVLFFGGRKGLVCQAYQPLDEFWITDAETGELVKDGDNIVTFRAADLELVSAPPARLDSHEVSGVLVVGREEAMVKVLEHFGQANTEMRCNPQQLLAIPCTMCADASKLAALAEEGIPPEVVKLGRDLRPDIHVSVRALQLRHIVERMSQEMAVMDGYYVLAAVQLPESLESIEAGQHDQWEAHRRRELLNQVDLCPTAVCVHPGTEEPEQATRMALGQTCGLEVSDYLWSEDTQKALRKRLNVDLPMRVQDSSGTQVVVTVLPEDVIGAKLHGVLCFSEPPNAKYEEPAPVAAAGARVPDGGNVAAAAGVPGKEDGAGGPTMGGKTVAQWEQAQAVDFAGLPSLPANWIRIKSRSSGEVYFFNKKTKETTYEMPKELPAGWTKQVSKSTGKVYYFHPQKKVSTFDIPTA